MYFCNDCVEYFDEPDVEWFDYPSPYFMGNEKKEYKVCPYCGSRDFEEV